MGKGGNGRHRLSRWLPAVGAARNRAWPAHGRLRGVVATNALELGIDIGQLDAAVITGYPGSIASIWQQAGRAGRRAEQSVAVLIASNSPLDQYICNHPRYLFGRSPEHALTNPDNLRIMVHHLHCAAYELPFQQGEDFGGFGAR